MGKHSKAAPPPSAGLYDELVTARVADALKGSDLQVELEDLDAAESHHVLARHLARVMTRVMRGVPEKERAAAQMALVRRVLAAARPDADDQELMAEVPESPGSVLTGLFPVGVPTPSRPLIALSDSALLVNGRGEPRVGEEVRREIESADRVDLLCAFIKWFGLRVLEEPLESFLRSGRKLRVITTTYLAATEPRPLQWLAERGAEVKVSYDTDTTRLHAKAWLFHRDTGFSTAYVGSSNLSKAAMLDGVEWNVRRRSVPRDAQDVLAGLPEVVMLFTELEKGMWKTAPKDAASKLSDQEINQRYDAREGRIVTEANREKLPNFVQALAKPDYIDLRPFYQRRERWDNKRQSRLIESFIINIPVPPLFLYEKAYNSYEVMDGQQRISALRDFYANEFKLTGLEIWPELNGKTYGSLPSKIKAGIDRRSISYVVLLKESAENDEDALALKQMVFERLNTGGVKLEHQEIRNCLYNGPLNSLLLRLSRHDTLTKAWGIPERTEDEEKHPPKELLDNPLFEKMGDAEIVLRFFALRHAEHFTRGMQGFLDLYMRRASSFTEDDVRVLGQLFEETASLATAIYGDDCVFRAYDPKKLRWADKPHRSLFDAQMIGLASNLSMADELKRSRIKVVEATKKLFEAYPPEVFTGQANTKEDVKRRINIFTQMYSQI